MERQHKAGKARSAAQSGIEGSGDDRMLEGRSPLGAASTAHPIATEIALEILAEGGSAVDASIAAQAIICAILPQAAGLGGDCLALINNGGDVVAVNGVGRSPSTQPASWESDGGSSVTVPGIAPAWLLLHKKFGRLALERVLQPAIDLAVEGHCIDQSVVEALGRQRERLLKRGASSWSLLAQRPGNTWRQPELGALLGQLASSGDPGSYLDFVSQPIAAAVARDGGTLSVADILAHSCSFSQPVSTRWDDQTLWVQPPPSQGALLTLAAEWIQGNSYPIDTVSDHTLIELVKEVFTQRDELGSGTLPSQRQLTINRQHASSREGPRAYLHTAGVAVADADGQLVSSLISVFDDFGSAVYVPELGIVLNNRAAGFTAGQNAPRTSAFPVHTLAPALLTGPDSRALALATPGADGQIQSLLQVLCRLRNGTESLAEAISAPRWRAQNGALMVEADHPSIDSLAQLGHQIAISSPGDEIFGAVVAAGNLPEPFAIADWRRRTSAGGVP